MSESRTPQEQAYEVPLVEQLRSIPVDYRTCREIQWAEDGTPTGHQFIPVGYMMHRAADELSAARRDAEELRKAAQFVIENLPGTLFNSLGRTSYDYGEQARICAERNLVDLRAALSAQEKA